MVHQTRVPQIQFTGGRIGGDRYLTRNRPHICDVHNLRRVGRQVQNLSFAGQPAVVDPDYHAVAHDVHLDHRVERQRPVGGDQIVSVIQFAVRGRPGPVTVIERTAALFDCKSKTATDETCIMTLTAAYIKIRIFFSFALRNRILCKSRGICAAVIYVMILCTMSHNIEITTGV